MEELKKFREKQGKTRAEMAHILGVSRSFYEKIEIGDINVSSNFLSKLKEKFPYVDVNIFLINNNMKSVIRKLNYTKEATGLKLVSVTEYV